MPQSRREQLRVAERRARVAALYLQGYKQFEIAARLGLEGDAGAMVVSRDLAAVRKAHTTSALRDYDFAKGQILAELALLKRELWASWELSRKAADGTPRPGDPRLAAQLLSCLDEEAALLGLRARPGEASTAPPVVAFRIHVPPASADGATVEGLVVPPQRQPAERLPNGLRELRPGGEPVDGPAEDGEETDHPGGDG
jgi:hypothetical protein